jgi:transcriptional regulator with XRE-family HTH domain
MLQLSAGEVSRRSGVGKSQLSKYETGKELPKLFSLQRVVDIYGFDLAGFFALVRMLDQISARRSALLPSLELEVLGQFTTPSEEQALSELTAAIVRFFHANLNARVQSAQESATRKARVRGGADE